MSVKQTAYQKAIEESGYTLDQLSLGIKKSIKNYEEDAETLANLKGVIPALTTQLKDGNLSEREKGKLESELEEAKDKIPDYEQDLKQQDAAIVKSIEKFVKNYAVNQARAERLKNANQQKKANKENDKNAAPVVPTKDDATQTPPGSAINNPSIPTNVAPASPNAQTAQVKQAAPVVNMQQQQQQPKTNTSTVNQSKDDKLNPKAVKKSGVKKAIGLVGIALGLLGIGVGVSVMVGGDD